jgi:hypothetical protein
MKLNQKEKLQTIGLFCAGGLLSLGAAISIKLIVGLIL